MEGRRLMRAPLDAEEDDELVEDKICNGVPATKPEVTMTNLFAITRTRSLVAEL